MTTNVMTRQTVPTYTATTRAASVRHTPLVLRGALLLLGVVGLMLFATSLDGQKVAAHASSGLHYQRGQYLASGWLCFGWGNGTYHCTQHWSRTASGQLVSGNPAWVPNSGSSTDFVAHPTRTQSFHGGAGAAPSQMTFSGSVQSASSAGEPCQSSQYFGGDVSAWARPSSCYGNTYSVNPANYVYRPYFGECNWWPEVMHPGVANAVYGNHARGSVPVPGSTIAFAPGVQGAGGTGHYGRVVAVAPGGYWMLISEMNFYFDGGGFGRVSYRYVHTGAGISFIYY